MATTVGTAYVRIRAITEGIGKQIEKDLNKGVSDAKVGDEAGSVVGGNFAKNAGEKITPGLNKSVKDGLSDKDGDAEKNGNLLGTNLGKGFDKALEKGNFKKVGKLISKRVNDDFKASFDADFNKAIGDGDFEGAQKLLKKRSGKLGDESGSGFLAALRRTFSSDGGKTGEHAGGLFAGGFKAVLVKAAVIASPAVLGAVSALLQYVVSLVGQIGFLATGLVGLGAAGGAAFGALGLAALPITLAFKATTPALKKFQKNLASVGKEWLEVGAATQKTMLSGLTYAANLSTNLIPAFRVFGGEIGQAVGEFARFQAGLLFTGSGLDRVKSILSGSVPIVGQLLRVIGNLIDVFLNVWKASLPAAQDFAETLGDITDRLKTTVAIATQSGALGDTIFEWYQRGKLVIGALVDIFVGLGHILAIGANSSGSFFTTFDKFAERFRAFTESAAGQNKLAEIFKQANAIAHEFNGLVGDIVKAIGGAVFDAGGADGIVGFIRLLRTDIVPFLDTFVRTVSSSYGPALQDLAGTFGKLLSSLSDSGALGATLTTLNVTLTIFNGILETLLAIPGMEKFIGLLLGLATAFGALKLLGIVKILAPIGGLLLGIIGSLVGAAEGAGALTILAGAFELLTGVIATALGTGAIATIGIFIAAVVAVAGAAYLIIRNWSTIKDFFLGIFNFLKRNFANIGQALLLLNPLTGIPLLIIKNWGKLKSFFSGLGKAILGFITDIPSRLGGFVDEIEKVLAKFGPMVFHAIVDGFVTAVTALPGIAVDMIAFWATLPILIAGQLLNLGATLIYAFYQAAVAVFQALPGMWDATFAFFTEMPGKIVDKLAQFGNMLLSIFTSAWNTVFAAVVSGWQTVSAFFSAIPGQVIGFLDALPERIGGIFTRLWERVKGIVAQGIENTMTFFRELPGKIVGFLDKVVDAGYKIGKGIIDGIGKGLGATAGFLGDLKDAVGKALKSVINSFIDKLNGAIPNSIGPFDLPDNPVPRVGALGGIFRRATNMIIGEDGTEALLPITKPSVMKAILRNNPAIAQAILAAMPTFESALARAGSAIQSATSAGNSAVLSTGRTISTATSQATTTQAAPLVGQIIVQGATFEGATATASELVRTLKAESFRRGK